MLGDYFRGARGISPTCAGAATSCSKLATRCAGCWSGRSCLPPAAGNPIVFIPLHWAPDAFMSQDQFKTYWWPSFRQLMLDLIAEDLIPMPMWNPIAPSAWRSSRTYRRGKAIYWFERADIVRAREVLGDTVALRGNVSPRS
ncbi:MAG: hypothetical protein H6871_11325 [Methylobacteriaceae bacterium]|nr:hypothetical protein [Methylobacteriaceae bacterium]